jgi:outer membrane receptor protein involved in Fe transport
MWDLIDFMQDPADSLFVYRNIADARAHGFEAELSGSLGGRGKGYLSYSYQHATDRATGERLSNSPLHMVKAGTGRDLTSWLTVGADVRYESSRRTLAGTETDPAFVSDLHLLLPRRGRFEVSLRLNNVFDATYATPGGPEHRQAAIAQDGRTLSAELRYRF